ncbi:MAG: 4-hydroxy-tetrahydrodipicolinate synthase [Xanthobacteraceae bacterium]|nr:4-hydroxy-tetrahydrodipicolinate synthase [Xanthobacteraceae bacterium]
MASARDTTATWLAGYIPDLPTPFDGDGTIDWAGLRRSCRRQLAAGAPALVVAETAGEFSTLTLTEHRAIVEAVAAQADGQLAVIAGASSNSTAHAVELACHSEAAGADALIAVAPYYNKPMQSGLLAHFRAIAEATTLPIILHDAPSRTARGIADETVAELAGSPRFIGLKDGSCDPARPLRLRPLVRPDFRLLSGDDATAVGYLAHGGDGSISQLATIAPAVCRDVYLDVRQGRRIGANVLASLAALAAALAEDGAPAALKYAMSLEGVMSPTLRRPLLELPEPARDAMRRLLDALRHAVAEDGVAIRRQR